MIIQSHLGLIKRSPLVMNKIEQQILDLNKDWLFDLVQSRQPYLHIQWSAKIDQTMRKFIAPL